MSRIGNRVLKIPTGIDVSVEDRCIFVKGSSGKLEINYNPFWVKPSIKNGEFFTEKTNSSKQSRAQFGTINALVCNAFEGLTKGFFKNLEIVGVGYKASMDGKRLRLDLGFSHPIFVDIPECIELKLISSLEIELKSFNKQVLGEFASKIRGFRPPEPYKGKGIKYKNEVILRKVGKTSEGSKK